MSVTRLQQLLDSMVDYESCITALENTHDTEILSTIELAIKAVDVLDKEETLAFMTQVVSRFSWVDTYGPRGLVQRIPNTSDFRRVDAVLETLTISMNATEMPWYFETFPQELAEYMTIDEDGAVTEYKFCVKALLRSYPQIDKKKLREAARESGNEVVEHLLRDRDDV